MKIGCVTRHSYPTDQEIRVTKFARTLNQNGYEFFVFCPGRDTQSSSEVFEHGEIIRLKPKITRWWGSILTVPLPINIVWAWWLWKQFRALSIDLVIVRDLRLSLPVLIAARTCHIKVILDLGEHYPGMMKIIGKQKIVHYFIRNLVFITWLEAISVRMADLVWVVVNENQERLKKYSSCIEVISNYPVTSGTSYRKNITKPFSPDGPPINLVSIGIIDNIRGLDLALASFSLLEQSLGNVRLLIYGDGPYRSILESKVQDLKLGHKIIFGGWIPHSEQFEVLRDGDIGLILHKVCDLTQHTIPNKLFDYMSIGLPVVTTPLRPIIRIVKSEQCGIIIDESPEIVASSIRDLILDRDKRARYSENGYRAMQARYRWTSEEDKLIRCVNSLIGKI